MITEEFPSLWESACTLLTDNGYRGFANFEEECSPVARIKMTPNAYIKSDAASDELSLKSANSNLKNSAAESSKKEGAASDKILFSKGASLSSEILAERQDVGRASLKESSAADVENFKENSAVAKNSTLDSARNFKENPVSQSAEDSAAQSKNFKDNSIAPHVENSTGGLATNDDSGENSKENSAMQDSGSSAARGKKSKANSKKNSAADAENFTQSSAPDSSAQGEEQ